MKKSFVILICLALLFNLAGCGGQAEPTATEPVSDICEPIEADTSAVSTVTGRITGIDGSVVTLIQGGQPGELQPIPGGQAPEMDMEELPSMPNGGNSPDMQTPPEMPGNQGISGGETPPDLPDGNSGNSFDTLGTPGESNTPPDMASGQQPPEGGTGPQGGRGNMTGMGPGDNHEFPMDEGESLSFDLSGAPIYCQAENSLTEGSLEDIALGDMVSMETDAAGTVLSVTVMNMFGPMGGFDGFDSFGSGNVEQGTAANTIDSDGAYTGTSYRSTGDDENALRIDGATVTLDDISVGKSAGASSNAETGDFYGMNAAVLATNNADVTITGAEISSSAQNGNGVFCYGQGTTVTISDSVITTTADNSGGIQTTGGGTTSASNLTVTTAGSSSAAIRSDRGGGTVIVVGGSYTSNGYNSPAVYSTADITVKNAQLTANNSEALVIEGKNSIALENCDVSGNMSDTFGTSSDINVHSVMIYQSMSGDADVGTSEFSMTGGSLISNNGDVIYVTNTSCVIRLSGVELINHETKGYFLLVSGNDASHGWGTVEANGAQTDFTADGQIFSGDIAVDTISSLVMKLTNSSTFTGAINIIPNAQNGTAVENNIAVTVESGSVWNLTGDCTLTSLTNNGTINFNGYTITLSDGTVLTA